MIAFAFLGNTLFLTLLVSMLSNTFSNISTNATAEMQFRRSVLTLEGVKADAVFAYQPPFNILAVFLFVPLKFIVSPRWFHKIHVATVKFINLPVLLIIAIAERRLLLPKRISGVEVPEKKFWQKWHLSADYSLRAVFDTPPPEDVFEDIAVDDEMTHHLIRRQFTRTNTMDSIKKATRRDSIFPGIRKKLRGSFAEGDDYEGMGARLDDMEKAMARMEVMLSRLLPETEASEAGEAGDDDLSDDRQGFSTEPSYHGTTQVSEF
jgi:hypothetical protein